MPDEPEQRPCPRCGVEVEYFSMPWRRVTARNGEPACRRMGPCPRCGVWLCPLLVWPSCSDDAGGWSLGTVDLHEVEQVLKGNPE